MHLMGNVVGKLDHAVQTTTGVVERVVGGPQPDHLTTLGDPFEAVGNVFTAVQALPELPVCIAAGIFMAAELTVVLAANLLQAVTHDTEKIVIRVLHLTSQVELDNRRRAVDRIQVTLVLMLSMHARSDVGRQLDHFDDEPLSITHRQVAGLQPDLAATLGNPHIAVTEAFTIGQTPPELGIRRAGGLLLGTEQAVVLAAQLIQAIAHDGQKGFVGVENLALRAELDHGKGVANGRDILQARRQILLALL
jgi:hypothetical protein